MGGIALDMGGNYRDFSAPVELVSTLLGVPGTSEKVSLGYS